MNINKYISRFAIFLFASFFLWACEKEITVELPESEEKIVVEGWIENGQTANVILSRNASYFAPINEASINQMFNIDAVVKVKEVETGTEEVLIKTLNPLFIPPVLYKGTSLTGKNNHHYELRIEIDGKVITATAYIPDTVPLDSSYFMIEPVLDTLGPVFLMFQDPPAMGNYYRIFSKRLNKDNRFVPVWGSIYDDALFNGQYINYSFYRGLDNYATQPDDYSAADFHFTYGDTIVTRFTVLNKAHFDFWRSYENAYFSGGNPFASPATIFSNVNGALGIWGGYAAVYDTCVAVQR